MALGLGSRPAVPLAVPDSTPRPDDSAATEMLVPSPCSNTARSPGIPAAIETLAAHERAFVAQLLALSKRVREVDIANRLAPSREADELRAVYRTLHEEWMSCRRARRSARGAR